jgi:predicted nucleic acid-binding protein
MTAQRSQTSTRSTVVGTALSTQVLQELCINLRGKISRPLPVGEVRLLIRDYATWEVVINTSESILQALEIELRYKTSFWGALISRPLRAQARRKSVVGKRGVLIQKAQLVPKA